MTIAGMIAAGLQLLTEAANALTAQSWILIRPNDCVSFIPPANTTGGVHGVTNVHFSQVDGGVVDVTLDDPNSLSAILKMCYDGLPFYLYLDRQNGTTLNPTGGTPIFLVNAIRVTAGLQ